VLHALNEAEQSDAHNRPLADYYHQLFWSRRVMSNVCHVDEVDEQQLLNQKDDVLPKPGEELHQHSVVGRGMDLTIAHCLFLKVMDCVLSVPAFPVENLAQLMMDQILQEHHPRV